MSRIVLDRPRIGLTLLAAVVLALATAVSAGAYLTSGGAGTGSTAVGTLAPPTIVSAVPGGGTVALAWSAVAVPAGTVTYSVTRDSGVPAGDCPAAAAPAAVLSCTDSGVAVGTHVYVVTAVWRTWTSVSSPASATVSTGAATKLVFITAAVSGQASSSAALGPLTVQRQDATGNPVAGAAVTVALSSSTTGTAAFAASSGGAGVTSVVIAAGSSSATFWYGDTKAGAPLITAAGAGLTAANQTQTVTAAAASKLIFTSAPQTITAGGAASSAMTVEREDAFGNPVPSGSTTVALSSSSSGAYAFRNSADTATITSVSIGGGASSASFRYRDTAAGAWTLTAADGSAVLASATQTVTVTSAAAQIVFASGNWNSVDTWTARPRTGTITTTTGSKTVAGTGTAFLTEVNVGDRILRSNGTTSIGLVQSIASNTSLTLVANASNNNTNAAFSARSIPVASEDVSVNGANGLTVTIPTGYAAMANNVTIGDAANDRNDALVVAGTGSLMAGGDVAFNRPSGNATNDFDISGGTVTIVGDLTFVGTATNTNRAATLTLTTGTVSIGGDLVLNAPAVAGTSANRIDMSGGAGALHLGGAFTIAASGGGALVPGTASTFDYAGAVAQTVVVGVTNFTYANLTLNNTSVAGATLSAAITAANVTGNVSVQSGTLDNGGFAIAGNGGKSFVVASGAGFEIGGTSGMVTGFGTRTFDAASTVDYDGAAQTVGAETYGNLRLSGSGTKTAAAGTITVAGSFAHDAGTFVPGTGTVAMTGSGTTIGGLLATSFNNLTIGAAVSLSGVDATVGATLALGGNVLTTGSNTIALSSTAAPTRTSGFVDGSLQRTFAAGASTVVFDVGAGSTYAPVSVSVTGANAGGTLSAATLSTLAASYASSGLSATKYVRRTWTLTPATLTVTGYDATFTFAAGDLVGSPNTAALLVRRWNGSSWNAPSTSSSTATTVTGTAFGTAFGEFGAGN